MHPFDTALKVVADRTASLVPRIDVYESDGSWLKPANALIVRVQMITAGQDGVSVTYPNLDGGGGGAAGQYVEAWLLASQVPSVLLCFVPQTFAEGDCSLIGANFELIAHVGTSSLPSGRNGGLTSPSTYRGGYHTGSNNGGDASTGGAGTRGDGTDGSPGFCAAGGAGGDGGTVGVHGVGYQGAPGKGYGGGGGGAGGSFAGGNYGGGGGGGGSGFGYFVRAGAADSGRSTAGTAAGGTGAPGAIVITTWCGKAL